MSLQEVYDQQKELILLAERVVLATLGFDLNVHHPYKPLVEAIRKFKVAQNALAQVAWNFVNDGYVLIPLLSLEISLNHVYNTLKRAYIVQAAYFALPAVQASSYCSRCYLFGC